mmetsp:Transcript_45682/g.76272  ORF Transcript_45682/g.76272 Transcript_45682/m.76272 type:complete len:272 (-) Transcript_45682:539-1354(-)
MQDTFIFIKFIKMCMYVFITRRPLASHLFSSRLRCVEPTVRPPARPSHILRLIEEDGLYNTASHQVGIHVGGRASVLKVAHPSRLSATRYTDTGTTVSNTPLEVVDAGSLVSSSQPSVVSSTVDRDMLSVFLAKLLHRRLNELISAWPTHLFGGHVCMASGSVPVTRDGFGVEGSDDAILLSNAVEEETGHGQVVTGLDAHTGSNLELPLAWKHLSVDARNDNTGIEAGTVVSLNDVTTKGVVSADTAVIGSLWRGVPVAGPSEGSAVCGE